MSSAMLATPSVLVSSPPSSTPVPPPPVEPGVTFIVPNLAALLLIDDTLYPSGSRARVMTLLDDFDLYKTSTLTLEPTVIVATQSGTGRWVRRQKPSAAWLKQIDWGINPSTGNDENVGTAAAPLRTGDELQRRIGIYGEVSPNFILQVLTSFPDAAPLRLSITLPLVQVSNTTSFLVKGTRTQVATGSLTGYTPLNRATPARNAITSATDFTAHVNRQIRLTSGTGLGYIAWIQAGAAGAATLTPWVQEVTSDTAVPPNAPLLQPAGITAGDTFEIFDCPSVGIGFLLSFRGAASTVLNAAFTVQARNLRNPQSVSSANNTISSFIESQSPGISFYWVQSDGNAAARGPGLQRSINSLIGNSAIVGNMSPGNAQRFIAGGTRSDATLVSLTGGGIAQFDGDFAFVASLVVGGGSAQITCFPAFAALGNVGFFTAGNAIQVNEAGCVCCENGGYGSHVVYGTAAVRGFAVIAGGKVLYVTTKPNINNGVGIGRETIIGGVDTLYAAIPVVNALNLAMFVVRI